jgi:hypothetical protein
MDEAQRPRTVEGVAAIPAAFGDIAAETAQDVVQLPQATSDAAMFFLPGRSANAVDGLPGGSRVAPAA